MAQLILDLGSGNTCKNDVKIVERMIREIADVIADKHEVILKWQLFKKAEPNIPLTQDVFAYAYRLANNLCLRTTASVFDLESMRFLMRFEVPFVKIACRPELYYLAEYSTVPVYVSTALSGVDLPNFVKLACVPKYPAQVSEYEETFTKIELDKISDHSIGWRLYNIYKPSIIEKHYAHEREIENPDSGPFAVTQKELAQIC